MKKIISLLSEVGILITGGVLLVLFFMWFPDFIVWYSSKMASFKMSPILEVVPLFVMVGGITGCMMLVFTSACNLARPTKIG